MQDFLQRCFGYCGVSSFSDSSLVQLIFLKIYRPLSMQSVLTQQGFNLLHLSLPRRVPLFQLILFAGPLQCLISSLTQSGWWWTLFLVSLVQSHCGEGRTLQTNNPGTCSQCLSHTGPAPAHGACTLPARTAQALGCSSGNCPRPVLGCMHLPSFRGLIGHCYSS